MNFRLSGLLAPAIAELAVYTFVGCAGTARRAGAGKPSAADAAPVRTASTGIMDASATYRAGGLVVHAGTLPFTGSVYYLPTTSPDSTLVLVTLSLANRAFTFAGDAHGQLAVFAVTLDFRQGPMLVTHAETRRTIRVESVRESMRADESVVFERFVAIPPGAYTLVLSVRDEKSANAGAEQFAIEVPRIDSGAVGGPIPVYGATSRRSSSETPELIANPRATAIFGRDSVVLMYVEAAGVHDGARVAVAVTDPRNGPVLADTVALSGPRELGSAIVGLPVARLGPGRLTVTATVVGSPGSASVPFFVTFGPELGAASYDEMLSYLRFFTSSDRLRALRDTAPLLRAAAWTSFWKATDPNPSTPAHEGLEEYFGRIRIANERFREESGTGWLTDRGRVFVTLGDPDQIVDQDAMRSGTHGQAQLWVYQQRRLQLVFVDQTGFGRWRLTPASEADFEHAAQQVRVR